VQEQSFTVGEVYYQCYVSSTSSTSKPVLAVSTWVFDGVVPREGGRFHQFSEYVSWVKSKRPSTSNCTREHISSLTRAREEMLDANQFLGVLKSTLTDLELRGRPYGAECSFCGEFSRDFGCLADGEASYVMCYSCRDVMFSALADRREE
jgi:hypothetical protein